MAEVPTIRFGILSAVTIAFSGSIATAQDSGVGKNLTLLGIDSATVAPQGLVFGSLSVTNRRVSTGDTSDGSAEVGFGLGNAETGIGLQFSVVASSLTDSFGDSGYFILKASRQIGGGQRPVYLGAMLDHIGGWGDANGTDVTGKLALTTFGQFQSASGESFPYMLTVGAGSHIRNAATDPGIYLGAGVGLSPTMGMSAAWTSETVDIGASFRPRGLQNVTLAATYNDVFDQEDSRRVTLSVTFALRDAFGR